MTEPTPETSSSPGRVVVYSYGVHYKWARNLPDVVVQQLRAAHSLREDLVAIQHEHEDTIKAIWSSYPEVAAAEEVLAAAEEAAKTAADRVKAERVKQQTKRITGQVADELKQARAEVKAAKTARREAIAAVKDEAAQRLAAAGEARKTQEKDLYRRYAQEGALYHSTFTDVVDAHRVAVARVRKQRAEGQASALRHHRFAAEGRLAVKLQRSAGQPPRTPEVLANPEGRYRNVLSLPGWVHPDEWEQLTRAEQRQRGRVLARMRVGGAGTEGGGEVIDIPIQYDRMLPADADVTGARLVIRKVGSKTKATLNVTAKLPAPTPVTEGPTVAVHLGWRRDDNGVRVATWRATTPLTIPPTLPDGVMTSAPGGLTGTVVIPDRLADRRARLEKEQSLRDDALNLIKARLIDWLDTHGSVDHPIYKDRDTGLPEPLTPAAVARWRSPGRFAVLAHHWREEPPTGADGYIGDDIAVELEEWRRNDKAAWDREAGGSRKTIAYRNDIYAQVAAVIGYQAARVVLGDESIADLARRTAVDEDLTNETAARFGHQRALAAPGLLRERIMTTCKREGVAVETVPAKNLTREHAACGTLNDTSLLHGHQVHCGCGRRYDVDANAVALMLARVVQAPGS